MSGPIVRTGATPKFWENWDQVFGKKKSKSSAAKSSKPEAKKTATAKKSSKAGSSKKATARKATKK